MNRRTRSLTARSFSWPVTTNAAESFKNRMDIKKFLLLENKLPNHFAFLLPLRLSICGSLTHSVCLFLSLCLPRSLILHLNVCFKATYFDPNYARISSSLSFPCVHPSSLSPNPANYFIWSCLAVYHTTTSSEALLPTPSQLLHLKLSCHHITYPTGLLHYRHSPTRPLTHF